MIWRAEVKDAFAAAIRGRGQGLILAGHLGVAETRGQCRRTHDVAECEALWNDWLVRLGTACSECGEYAPRCPFGVEVPARLRKAVELFGA